MPPLRRDASDPNEWLRRARGNLAQARAHHGLADVLLEDLCFAAQQAAEKSVKALLVWRSIPFPKTHVVVELLTLAADGGISVPDDVRQAARLTRFAVQARYPGGAEDVTAAEYAEALALAERVLRWAEELVAGPSEPAAPP